MLRTCRSHRHRLKPASRQPGLLQQAESLVCSSAAVAVGFGRRGLGSCRLESLIHRPICTRTLSSVQCQRPVPALRQQSKTTVRTRRVSRHQHEQERGPQYVSQTPTSPAASRRGPICCSAAGLGTTERPAARWQRVTWRRAFSESLCARCEPNRRRKRRNARDVERDGRLARQHHRAR